MKRILALVLILTFSLQITAFAAISKSKVDSFDNSVTIVSENKNAEIFDSILFSKKIYKEHNEYKALIKIACSYKPEEYFYKIDKLKIKTDDIINELPIEKQYTKLKYINSSIFGKVNIDLNLDNSLIDRIRQAKEINIRVVDNHNYDITAKLPDSVLAEWKQVINTEE